MLHRLGGLQPFKTGVIMDSLRHPPMIQLLSNAQLRKGTAYTYKQLHQIAAPQSATFEAQCRQWVQTGIFRRGYRFACDFCGLDRFYGLASVGAVVHCEGCAMPLDLGLDTPFAYQLNPLFCEGLKSGLLSTLIVLRYLQTRCDYELQWHAGVIVQRGQQTTDIDIGVQCDAGWTLIECKDHYQLRHLPHIIEQLERMVDVAQRINARTMLATLADDIPPALRQVCAAHDVSILTGAALRL